MRIRPLLAAAAALALAACSESSTSPRLSPTAAARNYELTCRSGYHIATRDDGTQYCASDDGFSGTAAAAPAP
jgi:uncharacterized lipoprotein YajG